MQPAVTFTFTPSRRSADRAGRRSRATANVRWSRPRWGATSPSSVRDCVHVTNPLSEPKLPLAWPFSTACLPLDAATVLPEVNNLFRFAAHVPRPRQTSPVD